MKVLLLAMAYRHRDSPIDLDDLERYAVVSGMQRSSLRAELYDFLASCSAAWPESSPIETLKTPSRESCYRLSPAVKDWRCDLSLKQIERLLQTEAPVASLPLMLALITAEQEFERGNYHRAERILCSATGEASPEQEVARRCLLNWIQLRVEGDGHQMRQATRRLLEWFEEFDTPERGLSDLTRAQVLIQRGRTPMTYQQRREARRLFLQAAKLLPETAWREKSSIEAGLGYVETRGKGGSLKAAEQHYRRALTYATLARWPWSVQVQQGNIADLLCEQYKRLPERPRQHPLLTEADRLLLESQALCDRFGFYSSGDNELYRARIAIWQNRLSEAWDLIAVAFERLDRVEAEAEYPFAWEIRGEWYLAVGEWAKGLSNLRCAAQMEEKLITGVDAPRLKARVSEVEKQARALGIEIL